MVNENFYKNKYTARVRQGAIHHMRENKNISDVFVLYLAMNYFDRFFSTNNILVMEETMSQEIELMAVSCLSLAFKMLKGERSGVIYTKQVEEAEERIRLGLGNNTRPITALAFAPHHYNQLVGQELPVTVSVIITEAQDDARFTAFKPSVISAASVLLGIADLHPHYITLFPVFVNVLEGIDKEDLKSCFRLAFEMCKNKELLPLSFVKAEKRHRYIKPTKGPKVLVSLKWAVPIDVPTLLREINGVSRLSCRFAEVVETMNYLREHLIVEEDPVMINQLEADLSTLEKKRTHLVIQMLIYRA